MKRKSRQQREYLIASYVGTTEEKLGIMASRLDRTGRRELERALGKEKVQKALVVLGIHPPTIHRIAYATKADLNNYRKMAVTQPPAPVSKEEIAHESIA